MIQLTSQPSWVLDVIVEIDRLVAGFCGEFFRSSTERRQVVAAYLAVRPPNDMDMLEVGTFLRSADHRAILTAAFGVVPYGLRGALRRGGLTVHEQRFYKLLHDLLAEPHHDEVVPCVSRLSSLDLKTLLVLRTLPPSICRANVVIAIRSTGEAKDVKVAYKLLVSRGIDEEALARSIRGMRNGQGLSGLFRNAMLKAQAPSHPVPASEDYLPIKSGEELYSMAREFQNCSRSYATRMLDEGGGHAFAVAQRGDSKVVVHLTRFEARWKLEGLFGHRNSRPCPDLREWVSRYLNTHGVQVEHLHRRMPSDWDSLRRLTTEHLFEIGLD